MYLLTDSCLVSLLADIPVSCRCGEKPKPTKKRVGSAVTVNWICDCGKTVKSLASQLALRYGSFLGNFMLMASTILSGNNYQKVALLAKFINLGLPHRTTFQKIQGYFVAPTVEQYWSNIQASAIEETRATNVVISATKGSFPREGTSGQCTQ
ncbi:hypothetical protein DPMN_130721 [Dreissena polymorpha]|uniref:Uncharacterized protein n=1 Tax=Dreissena polymorpha TaxID=45954 RepID=A0A9D4JZE7_DREPO|nr:hypothetical protein DPMN_130721 [Dreissena polymorpha]